MSGFEKRNRQKENTSRVKFRKKFSKTEKFLYQQERKVSRNLMLKVTGILDYHLSLYPVSELKRGLVNEGTLCKSATVPAAVILCESAHYVTASADVGRRCEGEISQKTCRNKSTILLMSNTFGS